MDYQIDLNQCYKTINNIGSTTYQNICDGSAKTVVWGTGDWVGNIFSFALLAMFVGFAGVVVFIIYKAIKSEW